MPTQTQPFLVNCPLCQAEFRTRPFTKPRQVRCPHCHNEVQLVPPEASYSEPPPFQEASSQHADTEPRDLLDYLEDLFLKMIVGVFRFILAKVPWELWCLLTTWFPTAVRSVKVFFLGVLWLLLVFGPLSLASHPLVAQTPLGVWYEHSPEWCHFLLVLYTGLALAGSVWGIYYVRRQRKRRK